MHVRKNNGDSLSGGERRRTEIARALAVDPKFILLDEPFAGVDPIAVEDIQSVVARLKYKNIGILITDHNVNETLSICDRAYLLIEGKIFKHGTAEQLAEDEQVRRLYLGTNFELKRKDWIIEMGKRQSGTLVKDRTVQYLSDYIIELDKLVALNNGELKAKIEERDFFKVTNEVIHYIKEYSDNHHIEELKEYTANIEALQLEQFSKQPALKDLTNNNSLTTLNDKQEDAFKEKLKELREILEKSRVIISNPAFKEVLSK
jgi:energy-coupling factor transporter ATP-binding protein EcfA2